VWHTEKKATKIFWLLQDWRPKSIFTHLLEQGQPKCEQGFSYIHLDRHNGHVKIDVDVASNTKWVRHIGFDNLN
jgi:hypothetical protein